MGKTQQLKRRIGSVKNTKQITKAMELVAASKMRRAQASAVSTRDYRTAAHDILHRIGGVSDVANHPLFVIRPIDSRLVILITSDRGLAGAYNGNVLKRLIQVVNEDKKNKTKTQVIAVGRVGGQFAARVDGMNLIAAHPMFARDPKPSEIRHLVETIFEMYSSKSIDVVNLGSYHRWSWRRA
jgi:F-type H+-transporting ATPase subunit gamma